MAEIVGSAAHHARPGFRDPPLRMRPAPDDCGEQTDRDGLQHTEIERAEDVK